MSSEDAVEYGIIDKVIEHQKLKSTAKK
jgi:ATP-dependent protease ClpP protease subunit